jgi:hypothetical protein
MQQFLVYADYVNILGEDISTINKNKELVLDVNREIGSEADTNKLNI